MLRYAAMIMLVVGTVSTGSLALETTESRLRALESELAQTKSELAETKIYLYKAIQALAGKSNEQAYDMEGDNHNIKRRDTYTPKDDNSHDEILSSLSLDDLIPLLSTRGRDGRDGKDGKDGKEGRDGRDCVPGVNATLARDGLRGAKGARGLPGVAGATGVAGAPGVAGPPGASPESGSVYTRWGRTSCDGNATLMYQGFAAASHYANKGGGANYQCLHPDPEYNNVQFGDAFSVISGTEYQTSTYGLFPRAANNQNVPCARCYSRRSAVVMIPARRTCNSGWTKEYEGYLMAGRNSHQHPTTYECVDQNPEYISEQRADTNGALFFFVVPDCVGTGTTGHCPPYDANKQLTCVVCSK